MKFSTTLTIFGAVVLVGGIGYVALNKDSADTPAVQSTGELSPRNTKKFSTNFTLIKEEKLNGELVDSFPKDKVRLYPGEIKDSLGKMNSAGDRGEWNVRVTTKDSFAQVDAAIREAYEADDWSIAVDRKSLMGGVMLTARSMRHTATITYDDMGEDGILINYGVSQR